MPILRTCIKHSTTREPDEYAGKVLEVLLTERGEGPVQWCGDTVPQATVLQQLHDHVIPSHQLKVREFCARLHVLICRACGAGNAAPACLMKSAAEQDRS